MKGKYEVLHKFKCREYKKALKVYAEIDKKDKEEKCCLYYKNRKRQFGTGRSMNFLDAICNFELNNEEDREQQAIFVLRENCIDDECLEDIKKIIEKQAKKLNDKIA